jgi:PAS domain S-box-containing protein
MKDEDKSKSQLMNELKQLQREYNILKKLEYKHKRAEKALRESEERFRGVAEESFDIIFMIDRNGAFTYVSPAIKKITGYKPDEILGKQLENYLPSTENIKISQAAEQLMKGEHIQGLELELIGKNKSIISFEINTTPMFKEAKIIGYQGIARDITDRKRAEEEMKKRFMRFKLEKGKLYLAKEAAPTISIEAFKDLLNVGYSGTIISRTPLIDFNNHIEGDFEFYWLSDNGGENILKPNFNKIKQLVKNLPNRKIVLLDRLDYLISKHGFEKVLSFVQQLRELTIILNHIIILSIDPSVLSSEKLRLIEKETFEIELLDKPNLPQHMIDVLRFIYTQNMMGLKPSYTGIGIELGLCKPTIRKRIRALISSGYMIENQRGRSKVVELTERGMNIFLD